MESGLQKKEIIILFYCLIPFWACSEKVNPKEQPIYDLSLAQNGDIIYRLGSGLFSDYFKDFSQRDKKFSHVGIIYKTALNDTLFVIHAEADDFSGIGFVKKESASVFLEDVRNWAIYRLKTNEIICQKVSDYAFQFQEKKIPFDTAFDTQDSSAFYCTELVAHCINNAFNKKIIKANTVHKNSIYIAIDDTYQLDCMALIIENAPKKQ